MPWRCGCANLEASDEEVVMNRLMIVAKLREDAYDEAEILLREGPPFDPEAFKLDRHALTPGAYVSITEHDGVQRPVNVIAPVVDVVQVQLELHHAVSHPWPGPRVTRPGAPGSGRAGG